jgi:hypothetical protein
VRDRYSAICATDSRRVVRLDAAQPAAEVTKAMLAAVRERLTVWRADHVAPRM